LSRLVALVALLILAPACGGTGSGSASSPSPSAAASASKTPTPGLTFKLNGIATTAKGTITVSSQSGSMTVELKVTGLLPTSRHVSHIHIGSCAARGKIIFALNPVIADGQGGADARTTLKAIYPPASGHWYVVVHVGPDMSTTANSTYLLCGNIFK
jgi:hypothetical protein